MTAGARASGAYSAGHPFFGNQWSADAQAGATPAQLAAVANAMANPVHVSGGGKSGSGSKSGSGGGKAGAAAKKAASANKAAAKKSASANKAAAKQQQTAQNKAARQLATLKTAAATAKQRAAKDRLLASQAKTASAKASYTARAQQYEDAAVKLEDAISKASGNRHAGPGHDPVATGHVKANPTRARVAHKKRFVADADHLEGRMRQAMLDLFDHQEKRTLSALNGSRGRRIRRLTAKRADDSGQTPEQPEQPPATPDASVIFPAAFWTEQTASAAQPIFDQAADTAAQRVTDMLGLTQRGSLDAVHQVLAARTNRLAGQVTQTTFDQIQQALSDGIAEGDSTAQLADRVRHVFQVGRTRAELIARTEAIGSLNEAANAYANSLPAGTVGRKEWLAVHDQRTRMTHRMADGQQVALTMPFVVGGFLMMHPGDPTAPPSEVCNCRCSTLYLPGPALSAVDAGGINTIGEAA